MAKIDDLMSSIHAGFQNPQTMLYQAVIDDETRKAYKLRSRNSEADKHHIWVLSVGEMGQNPHATFYGYKPSDCIKLALAWRGLPTASKGKGSGKSPQAQAG